MARQPLSILINLSLDRNSLRTQSFNLVWFGLLNLKISDLFVVVRGFEPLREEPKSPMLTITSHNNNQPRLYLTIYLGMIQ